MIKTDLEVKRTDTRLLADPKRVITRTFLPGGDGRLESIIRRVEELPDSQAASTLQGVLTRFEHRHKDIIAVFERNFATAAARLNGHTISSTARRHLAGAYFTSEYSLESVALFNPSLVAHPDQTGIEPGAVRVIMSLRACGEGHVSSIEFRSGMIKPDGEMILDEPSPYAARERAVGDHLHDKNRFYLKLSEMDAYLPLVEPVLSELPDEFGIDQLERALATVRRKNRHFDAFEDLAETMLWVIRSSYRLKFPVDSVLSERVIFPVTENESRGIEDARFVRFTHDDGQVVYYATYTAYNGFRNLPQFIETTDFVSFRVNTQNGRCVQDKGMALFPRKVHDRFMMVSRLDGESIYVLRSDDIHFWNEAEQIHTPTEPWEFVQVGNCGSPIETEAGWLLLTHGVGPMREYWIGALLLDIDDPSRVLGHLKEPMLVPNDEERDGYVPNVVYSCGAMVHNEQLIIPYAVSDTLTRIATVSLPELLSLLLKG